MTDILTALRKLAVSVFREKTNAIDIPDDPFSSSFYYDAVLQEASRASSLWPVVNPSIDEFARLATAKPEFGDLAAREGELDPMVLHPGGGMRTSAGRIFSGLLSSAFLRMYFLKLPQNEEIFVRTVLEGFDELRRATMGQQINAIAITGISRITLPEGRQISTPWGVVQPAPAIRTGQVTLFDRPKTTCILARKCLIPIRFDRAPSPKGFDSSSTTADPDARILFPLSCALASKETAKPLVPLLTWSTFLLPFQGSFGYSLPFLPRRFETEKSLGDRIEEVEKWANIVHGAHVPAVDIAAGRLISAIANRTDRSDSLIDAVMVWENLVGASVELTFRVTAALTKLLESDATKRRAFRKELAEIYTVRSQVIHGVNVTTSRIDKACSRGIDIAVQALRVSYLRGRDWLAQSSDERADQILMEWQ